MATAKPHLISIYTVSAFGGMVVRAKLDAMREKTGTPYKIVQYIPKGARKPLATAGGDPPMLIVLSGHDHPAPPSGLDKTATGSISRYSSFDPRYTAEFNVWANAYLATLHPATVLLDQRSDKSEVADIS